MLQRKTIKGGVRERGEAEGGVRGERRGNGRRGSGRRCRCKGEGEVVMEK